jgi:hypothetical protein
MITVEKLFDDGEDVLGSNPDVTFLHIVCSFFYMIRLLLVVANSVPKLGIMV